MLCRRCRRAPSAVCSTCGTEAACYNARTSNPVCEPCYAKHRERLLCSKCGRSAPAHARSEAGEPLCNTCSRRKETCCRCENLRKVSARLENGSALCVTCLEREPAYYTNCSNCDEYGRMANRGLCARCACPLILRRLFGDNEGALGGAASAIVDALCQCDPPKVIQWAERAKHRKALASSVREMGEVLDHEALDQLPPSRSVEWLRNILVETGAIPFRDTHLRRAETRIHSTISKIVSIEDRSIADTFAKWHHLRRLRAKAERAPLKSGNGLAAEREMSAITTFLNHLHDRNLSLQSCTQLDVDAYLAGDSARSGIHIFLKWSADRGLVHGLQAAAPQPVITRPTLPGKDARWALVRRLLHEPEIETRDRVAGLLVLLYSQQTTRLVRLKASDVTVDSAGTTTVALGEHPLTLPPAIAPLFVEICEQRRGYAAVHPGKNEWLFPGGRAGDHLSPAHMGRRLAAVGVPPRLARNTALIDLAGELPAAVLAKLLGFSISRAVVWNAEAGNTRPQYAADVAAHAAKNAKARADESC